MQAFTFMKWCGYVRGKWQCLKPKYFLLLDFASMCFKSFLAVSSFHSSYYLFMYFYGNSSIFLHLSRLFLATSHDMLYMFGRKESQFHAFTTSKSIFEQYVLYAVGISATTLLYQKPNEWWWFSFLHHQYRFVWACVHVIFFGFLAIHVCSLILYRTDRLSLLCLHFFFPLDSLFLLLLFLRLSVLLFFSLLFISFVSDLAYVHL